MGLWLGFSWWLLWIKFLWTKVFFVDTHFHFPEVSRVRTAGSYGKRIFQFLTNCQMVPKVILLFYIPISNARVFQLFHSLTSTWHDQLMSVIWVYLETYLQADFICIFLVTDNVVHLFMCLLLIYMSLFVKCLLKYLANFYHLSSSSYFVTLKKKNPLDFVRCIINIFSQPIACIFIFSERKFQFWLEII